MSQQGTQTKQGDILIPVSNKQQKVPSILIRKNVESLHLLQKILIVFSFIRGWQVSFQDNTKKIVVVLIFKELVFKTNNTILIHPCQLASALG